MHPQDIPIYKYIQSTPTWSVRAINILAALTWLGVLYGYSRIPTFNPGYFFLLAPGIIFFTIYFFISYAINIVYKQPSLKAHHKLVEEFWQQLVQSAGGGYFYYYLRGRNWGTPKNI